MHTLRRWAWDDLDWRGRIMLVLLTLLVLFGCVR